jgi:Cys-rich protein (TIGR01571 family)
MNNISHGQWHTGICECSQHGYCSTCCLACFCPCIQFGINYKELKKNENAKLFLDNCIPKGDSRCCLASTIYLTIMSMAGVGYFVGNLVGIQLLSFLSCIQCFNYCLQYDIRSSIEDKNNIHRDICCDILAILCCTSCAMTQEYAQLDHVKKARITHGVQVPTSSYSQLHSFAPFHPNSIH